MYFKEKEVGGTVEAQSRLYLFADSTEQRDSSPFASPLVPHLSAAHPPAQPFPSLPTYQDVWEADVIVMTQRRTLRNGSEQAATVPFPSPLWQRETG